MPAIEPHSARPAFWSSIVVALLAGSAFGGFAGLLEMAAFHAATGLAEAIAVLAVAIYSAAAFTIVAVATVLVRTAVGRFAPRATPDLSALIAVSLLAALLVGRCLVDGGAIRWVTSADSAALFAIASALGALGLAVACLRAPAASVASISLTSLLVASALVYGPFFTRLALGERVGGLWFVLLVALAATAGGVLFRLAMRLTPQRAVLVLAAVLLLPSGWRAATGPPSYLTVLEEARPPIAPGEISEDGRLNVILIVLDTLRADHLEIYGYGRETMPQLASFARRARLYTACLANSSWSLPSHATLFTGLYPRQHGAIYSTDSGGEVRPLPLAQDVLTLAEILRSRGYHTAGISSNYSFLNSQFGLNQGFDHWDSRSGMRGAMARGFWPSLFRSMPVVDKFRLRWIYEPLVHLDVAQVPYRRAPEINRRVLAWIEQQNASDGAPFFLFVNYMDAHDPFRAPGEFADVFPGRRHDWPRDRNPRAPFTDLPRDDVQAHFFSQYDSELAYLDFHLGRLFERLEAMGLLDRSLVVIIGDHGEQFFEHDEIGHGMAVYQEEIHVPLIIYAPGAPPTVVEHPVEQRDVAPWLLERLGLQLPANMEPSDLLQGQYVKVAELFHSERGPQSMLRGRGLALVRSADGGDEIYDLEADPGQRNEVAAEHPDAARQLADDLTRWTREHEIREGQPFELDPGALEELRELGYIQ